MILAIFNFVILTFSWGAGFLGGKNGKGGGGIPKGGEKFNRWGIFNYKTGAGHFFLPPKNPALTTKIKTLKLLFFGHYQISYPRLRLGPPQPLGEILIGAQFLNRPPKLAKKKKKKVFFGDLKFSWKFPKKNLINFKKGGGTGESCVKPGGKTHGGKKKLFFLVFFP